MEQQRSTDENIARVAMGKRHAEDLAKRMLKLSDGEQVVTVLRACEMVALNALMNVPEGLRQANLGQFIYALCGDIMVNVQQQEQQSNKAFDNPHHGHPPEGEQAEKSPEAEATGRSAEEVVQRTENRV